ncbi:MAG: LytTR family DNA-binding domain-containing protein [Lachnospiraceae bacterium]|nr:LytTR family DNA-binding domain-containing protein [Lachnospiraceae bacterium]
MLKIAICDNDSEQVEIMRELISVYNDFEIYTYYDPRILRNDIAAGNVFDIYLLDIVMPNISGIEIAEQIRINDETAFIIFMTHHGEHALSAFSVRAFQYLLKPVDTEILYRELEFAREHMYNRNHAVFPFKTREGLTAIPFHRIAYCRVENRCIICVLDNHQVLKGTTMRISFSKAIAPLLTIQYFVRTHVSFVVNMNHVSRLQEHDFLLKDNSLVPIAQNSYLQVKERYLSHVFGGDDD